MQNCKTSARTAAKQNSKSPLLFRQAALAAILMLAVCFSSCRSKSLEDYNKKCLELDIKKKELDYLKQLYSVKSDIEFAYKIKKLDSLINDASRLK